MNLSKLKIALLPIDPQYDFHDIPEDRQVITGYDENNNPIRVAPALPVPGSWEDAQRLGAFIEKFMMNISKIVVTLDSHQRYDIAHPLYWKDKNGNAPTPFTPISNQEIKDGTWTPVNSSLLQHALDYTATLEAEGKYALFIWPPHCLVGEPGHNIVQPVMEAIAKWEEKRFTRYMPLAKGHNPHTEHYGGCEAEYPMPNDPSTRLNKQFINSIESNDLILITGQALSHCVASTVRQIADNFSDENIKKLVLLVDTTSSVSGFEQQGKDFIDEMVARGMRIAKTTDFKLNRNGQLEF
jgi:nicotinamidase/pyrazinamidase